MLSGAAQQATTLNWVTIMTSGGPVAMVLDLLLIVLSIVTWGIIIERWISLSSFHKKSEIFLRGFWSANDFASLYKRIRAVAYSPAREVFREGYEEMVRVMRVREQTKKETLNVETVRRALSRARGIEEGQLTRSMSFLAIAASACPFIGLFGTVIGIIRSFQDIGATGSTSLAAVAPGISEALVATALGLVSAIPAVIFYNVLNAKVRKHMLLLDSFSIDFLNIIERNSELVQTEQAPKEE
jgi:biopolymer transport protein TolQ